MASCQEPSLRLDLLEERRGHGESECLGSSNQPLAFLSCVITCKLNFPSEKSRHPGVPGARDSRTALSKGACQSQRGRVARGVVGASPSHSCIFISAFSICVDVGKERRLGTQPFSFAPVFSD